jgi:hypothetical protein
VIADFGVLLLVDLVQQFRQRAFRVVVGGDGLSDIAP